MIQPFKEFGIVCNFYKVVLVKGRLEVQFEKDIFKNDVILVIEYFGYRTKGVKSLISNAKRNGIILIEDLTHNVTKQQVDLRTHYSFASFRKWTGITSGGNSIKKMPALI